MTDIKTIPVSDEILKHCGVKHALASDLTFEEIDRILHWCKWQSYDLWEDMSLQEILNVYRISAEWDTWQVWAEHEPVEAFAAWNSAVINPGNKMYDSRLPNNGF
jgi:hypothetical protein